MTCRLPYCDRPSKTKELCSSHYQQQWEGRPIAPLFEHHAKGEKSPCYKQLAELTDLLVKSRDSDTERANAPQNPTIIGDTK